MTLKDKNNLQEAGKVIEIEQSLDKFTEENITREALQTLLKENTLIKQMFDQQMNQIIAKMLVSKLQSDASVSNLEEEIAKAASSIKKIKT